MSKPWLVEMARGLGIQAERPLWAWAGGAARGPYRGLDAMIRLRGTRLLVSLAHPRPLNLGLHAGPSSCAGVCDWCDVFARNRPLGTPELVGYADDPERAEALLSTPAVRAAFAVAEAAGQAGRFAVHVNDTVVCVEQNGHAEPTPGLLDAMHALSLALVSSAALPDTRPVPPLRRSVVARVLFVLLVPPAFCVGVLALGIGVGPPAAYVLTALFFGALIWTGLRGHLRIARRVDKR